MLWYCLGNRLHDSFSRAVAIRFGVVRLVVRAQERYTLGGVWGHAPPEKF